MAKSNLIVLFKFLFDQIFLYLWSCDTDICLLSMTVLMTSLSLSLSSLKIKGKVSDNYSLNPTLPTMPQKNSFIHQICTWHQVPSIVLGDEDKK